MRYETVECEESSTDQEDRMGGEETTTFGVPKVENDSQTEVV